MGTGFMDYARHMKVCDLVSLTTLSKSTIHSLMRIGTFPLSIPLLGRSKVWLFKDVETWMSDQIAARNLNNQYDYRFSYDEYRTALPKFISTVTIAEKFKIPRSSLYELMKTEGFPLSVELSLRRVAWVESEVVDWVMSRKPQDASHNISLI